MSISDYSTTPASNTSISGINIAEGCSPAGINNAIRQMMADIAADARIVPTGGIIMWSGSIASIPATWVLCDGTSGTPDLRDRFIAGAGGAYAPNATGGAASVTLTTAQLPVHTHAGTTNTAGAHSHTYADNVVGGSGNQVASGNVFDRVDLTKTTSTAGAHTHSFTTDAAGSGTSHENRPPYYALAYIMKL